MFDLPDHPPDHPGDPQSDSRIDPMSHLSEDNVRHPRVPLLVSHSSPSPAEGSNKQPAALLSRALAIRPVDRINHNPDSLPPYMDGFKPEAVPIFTTESKYQVIFSSSH